MRTPVALAMPILLGLSPVTARAAVHADGDGSASVSREAFAVVTGRSAVAGGSFAADASSIRPLAMGGSMDRSRAASISGVRSAGSDASDAEVKPTTISHLPEPATWAMMVAGFGLAALGLRRHVRASERRFTERMRRIAEGRDA